MTNKEIHKLMQYLGLIEEEELGYLVSFSEDTPSREEIFENHTCKEIRSLTNFVNYLIKNNNIYAIKDFLICFLFENGQEKNNQ